jgi:hypothetical protein
MKSGQHAPYGLGYTCATMAITKSRKLVTMSKSLKDCRSPDGSLQLEILKLESLVIVDHHATVNKFSSLVLTARRVTKIGSSLSALSIKEELVIGAKS